MKILYLITSLEAGGAEFAIPDIVKAIQHQGHQVYITALEPRDMGAAVRLKQAGLPYKVLCRQRRKKWIVLAALLKRIFFVRPDVILTSLNRATHIGQLAGRRTRVPVVSFKNSTYAQPSTYHTKEISRLWIGDSQTVVRFLQEELDIPANKIMKWSLYRCNPAAVEAQGWDGKSVLQLGSVGNLQKVKNYDLLIEGLSLFVRKHPQLSKRIHLSITGEGEMRSELEAKITQLGLCDTISLPGHSNEVEQFLAGLHAYIQPSHFEGLCIAAHEAMNAGLPIIATPVGELQDCVQEGKTGFLLKGEIAPAICEVLERLFTNPTVLPQYGKNARQYVQEKYSQEAFEQAAETVMARISQDVGKQ